MINLGLRAVNSTVRIPWNSNAADGSSITRATDGTIRIYKDGGTTERSSSSGVTNGEDFDGITGVHAVSIDLSDNADAGFYAAGSVYEVMLVAATIDGKTVNNWLGRFEIGVPVANVTQWNSSAVSVPTNAGVPNVNVKTWNDLLTVELPLVPTTAGRKLDVTTGGEAGIDWSNVGAPTTTLNLSGTTVGVATTLTNAPSDSTGVTTLLSRLSALRAGYLDNLSAGAVALEASITTVLSKMLKYVQLIVRKDTAIGTDNSTEKTAINADGGSGAGAYNQATDALEALRDNLATQVSVDDLPTNAELATALGTADDAVLAAIAALNNLSQANIRTALGLATANLDTQLGDLPTNAELATALGTADDAILAAIAALNNLAQVDIRTALGLATANLDTQIGDLPTNAELATALAGADDAILAAVAALNNLSQANIRTALGVATANLDTQLGDLPTNAELATALGTADDAVLAAVAALDVIAAAVKVVTDKYAVMIEADGGGYRFTENTLEEAPSGTGGDATLANQELILEDLVKVLAAVYNTATVSGNVITLSNGVTLTITTGGRVTA